MSNVSLVVDGGRLQGVFEQPTASAIGLGALILPGSGPTDRDGNQPSLNPTLINDSLKSLAAGLRRHGIATLRVDKRGVGASRAAASQEEALRLETYVSDGVAWLNFLKAQSGIIAVALIGHSEGALIATLAAQRVPVAASALIAGPGRVATVILREQFAAHLPAALQQRADNMLAEIEAGQAIADVPPEFALLFRPSLQPYLRSWLAYDPAVELAKVTAPVAIIQGRRDLQVSVADAERLAAANPGAVSCFIDDMNHVLKSVPDDRDANLASYHDPHLPLAPALLPVLARFLVGSA